MDFLEAIDYLKENAENKTMTIKLLNKAVQKTELFPDIVNCYFLSDCIYDTNKCIFNSIEYNNEVINIELTFLDIKDFEVIKNMSWKNEVDCNNIKIKINCIDLYQI
jgi:hypothetical protein